MEQSISIKSLEENFDYIIENVIKHGDIYNVSCESGNVVLISKEQYASLIETLYLSNQTSSLVDGLHAKHEDMIKEEDVNW